MRITRMIGAGFAFAFLANVASAALPVGTTKKEPYASVANGEKLYAGSDTFNQVMDKLLNFDGIPGNGEIPGFVGAGIDPSYQGVGSSAGERYMVGKAGSSTPTCTLLTGVNVGCQEVTPMSRQMGSVVCSSGGYDPTSNPNTFAEGLAVANDGVVIIGDNKSYQQYSSAACTAVDPTPNDSVAADYTMSASASGQLADSGTIPGTGYTLGAGALSAEKWQDVIRLVYTGCKQGDGLCTTTVQNSARCADPVRAALLDNYGSLFKGSSCSGPGNCTKLRKAYRRDDASGTTGVFLSTIGVAENGFNATLGRRVNGLNGFVGINAASQAHPFCDGFDFEGVLPGGGDPIRRPCAAEDDICRADGTMGVVRAIVSTPGTALDYPKVQCTRGSFALVPFVASSYNICPDGKKPVGGSFCNMPFYNGPSGRDFNCTADPRSLPPGAVPGSFDGRVYNAYVNETSGATKFHPTALSQPVQAQWRENYINIKGGAFTTFAGPYAPADTVCQLDDATQNIGCLVGNTTCAWGFAGRETAALTDAKQSLNGTNPGASVDLSLKNEAFSINAFGPTNAAISSLDFPFARELFFNSQDGFENLTTACLAAGRTAAFCADEKMIADAFYNNTIEVRSAFVAAGFIPKDNSVCRGAVDSAGCGAPNTATDAAGRPQQVKTACLPQ